MKRVLDVGNCALDHGSISALISKQFGADVVQAHGPEDAREFETTFGLNQPGAQVALKVFVILETGNEAGSEVMLVTRPVNEQLLAA